MGSRRAQSGEWTRTIELSYLMAVRRGAPPARITEAVTAVLDHAIEARNVKALMAILSLLVMPIERREMHQMDMFQDYLNELEDIRKAHPLGDTSDLEAPWILPAPPVDLPPR